MITAASVDELPVSLPTELREAIAISGAIDHQVFQRYGWKHMPTAVLLRFTVKDGEVKAATYMLNKAGVTRALAVELRELIRGHEIPNPPRGQHVGTGAISEGLRFRGIDSLPDVTGPELDELVADLVAEGKVLQMRSSLTVLSSGWRYEYRRERAGNRVSIDVYEPGDPWEQIEVKLLAALDAKLLTRS